MTPFTADLQIDAVALGHMLDTAYADAGCRPVDVDTGVVILTGEALRRRNADRIASVVSQRAGDLVCATAGHHMEAMLAAYGSGAVLASHDTEPRVLNVDIGGGTTKLALIENGRVLLDGGAARRRTTDRPRRRHREPDRTGGPEARHSRRPRSRTR